MAENESHMLSENMKAQLVWFLGAILIASTGSYITMRVAIGTLETNQSNTRQDIDRMRQRLDKTVQGLADAREQLQSINGRLALVVQDLRDLDDGTKRDLFRWEPRLREPEIDPDSIRRIDVFRPEVDSLIDQHLTKKRGRQ